MLKIRRPAPLMVPVDYAATSVATMSVVSAMELDQTWRSGRRRSGSCTTATPPTSRPTPSSTTPSSSSPTTASSAVPSLSSHHPLQLGIPQHLQFRQGCCQPRKNIPQGYGSVHGRSRRHDEPRLPP